MASWWLPNWGGYTDADDADLVVGSNTAGDGGDFQGGTAEFFDGTIDALELFVLGTSTTTSAPYAVIDRGKRIVGRDCDHWPPGGAVATSRECGT